jgi:glyoxylase-like metal-dependent hydrolase (beta-lactamase superfamily II)
MQFHSISTGTIRIKNNHRRARADAFPLRFASLLLDPTFTEPLPMHVWVIEHEEGVILVDTGENARVTQPDYFPSDLRPVLKRMFRFDIAPEDEIAPQLRRLGIAPEDVRTVVFTHFHLDHADGIAAFPNAAFYASRTEVEHPPQGALPSRWPSWFRPRPVDYVPEPFGTFTHSFPLTKAGDVRLVSTPGHTAGHQSVIAIQEGISYCFAGDLSFDVPSLLKGQIDGVAHSPKHLRESQRQMAAYARSTPTVYLPTHDQDSARRLRERETLRLA